MNQFKRMQRLAGVYLGEQQQDAGELEFDKELEAAANAIATTLGKELKSKKAQDGKLDEAVATTVIAAIMTGNAIVGLISKLAKSLFTKLNWKKGEDIAEKVHHWAHDNEKAFQAPIKRVLGFFIKDAEKLQMVVQSIYAIVVLSMAASAGAGALSKIAKADWFAASFKALKVVAKGDEVIQNAYPVIKAIV